MSNTIIPPDILKVTLNTSVPGYQTILYRPVMSDPKINQADTNIRFNSTVKLNPALIRDRFTKKKISVNDFLNKGLFDSIVRDHGPKQRISLTNAVETGIIDNNIQIILKSVFKDDNVIYIGNKPYVIVDMQWRKGDWEMMSKYDSRISNVVVGEKMQSTKLDLPERVREKLQYGKLRRELMEKDSSGKGITGKGITGKEVLVDDSEEQVQEEEMEKQRLAKETEMNQKREQQRLDNEMKRNREKEEMDQFRRETDIEFSLEPATELNNWLKTEWVQTVVENTVILIDPDVTEITNFTPTISFAINTKRNNTSPNNFFESVADAVNYYNNPKNLSNFTTVKNLQSKLQLSAENELSEEDIIKVSNLLETMIICFKMENGELKMNCSILQLNYERCMFLYYDGKYKLLCLNNTPPKPRYELILTRESKPIVYKYYILIFMFFSCYHTKPKFESDFFNNLQDALNRVYDNIYSNKNYYDILGLPIGASTNEIVRSYRTLALTHHPDRGGDASIFQQINNANEELTNDYLSMYIESMCEFLKILIDKFKIKGNPLLDELSNQMKGQLALRGGANGPVYNIYNNFNNRAGNIRPVYHNPNNSKYCYHVTIDLELRRGTKLSVNQKQTSKCRSKWNNVRRAFADLMGAKYVIPPVYEDPDEVQPPKKGGGNFTRKRRNTKKIDSYL